MSRLFDRARFFRQVRQSVFRGRLSPQQVRGVETLLTVWEREHHGGDVRHLAYCLATAWHETAHTMQPVRETLARSERQAIARLRKWARKLPPHRRKTVLSYARVHADTGHAYFGRGYVQITWRRNYRQMGRRLGLDLERNPEAAMQPQVAARILFTGMLEGLFTGRTLRDYIHDARCDYVAARRVVNGLDKARLIAGAAEEFERALRLAARAGSVPDEQSQQEPRVAESVVNPLPGPPPEVVERDIPTSDKPPVRSTTILAALLAALAQAGAVLGNAGAWRFGGLAIGLLAVAWIVKERIRHAREDGV